MRIQAVGAALIAGLVTLSTPVLAFHDVGGGYGAPTTTKKEENINFSKLFLTPDDIEAVSRFFHDLRTRNDDRTVQEALLPNDDKLAGAYDDEFDLLIDNVVNEYLDNGQAHHYYE